MGIPHLCRCIEQKDRIDNKTGAARRMFGSWDSVQYWRNPMFQYAAWTWLYTDGMELKHHEDSPAMSCVGWRQKTW